MHLIKLEKHPEKEEHLNSEYLGNAIILGFASTIFTVSVSSPERCFQARFRLFMLSTDNRAKEAWTITGQNT